MQNDKHITYLINFILSGSPTHLSFIIYGIFIFMSVNTYSERNS